MQSQLVALSPISSLHPNYQITALYSSPLPQGYCLRHIQQNDALHLGQVMWLQAPAFVIKTSHLTHLAISKYLSLYLFIQVALSSLSWHLPACQASPHLKHIKFWHSVHVTRFVQQHLGRDMTESQSTAGHFLSFLLTAPCTSDCTFL